MAVVTSFRCDIVMYDIVMADGWTVRELLTGPVRHAIRRLSPEKLTELRAWFATFDAEAWDRDFDEDVRKGLLDQLGDEALADLDEERCS